MSRSSTIRNATIAFLVLTWITLLVRCWVRLKVVKRFGIDDKWMVAAQLFYTAFTVVTIEGTIYGFGKHTADLSPSDLTHALEFWWIGEITYSFASATAKIAICLFLLRIVCQKVYKWIIYTTMALSATYSLCFVFIVVFQCHPPSYYWDRNQPGHCLNPEFIINTSIAFGVVSMVTDFTIGILPIFIVWRLQMNKQSKFAVVGVLAMAACASIATVIRFPYLPNYSKTKDLFWEVYGISLWSNVEPGLGITAANLATMRPLLHLVFTNMTPFLPTRRSSQGYKVSRHNSWKTPSHLLGNERATLTQLASAHIARDRVQQNVADFTSPDHAELQGSESEGHTWYGDSKEGFVHMNEDIEFSGAIYKKSEVTVTEEIINKPNDSGRK